MTTRSLWAAAVLLPTFAVVPYAGLTQNTGEEALATVPPAQEEEEAPAELAEQVVTGSRMQQGDPSARIVSLSAEDIARRGVSNLEELFRTLPWAYSSINSQTTGFHSIENAEAADSYLGILGLGTSTVNLRAMGSANTLVLVNGRRVAGTAGNEEDFANLINVPLSAIERIDIQLDGASAVYGADAIGGVVNFITKKSYTGLSATVREEFSATDADSRNMSLLGGYGWGSGNVTVTASRDRSKPVNNFKLWTSNDFREQFGPEFDNRDTFITQPGRVCDLRTTFFGTGCNFLVPYRQLPATNDGTNASEADFTTDIAPTDYVAPQNGEDRKVASFAVNIEQYLTDSLRIRADAQASNAESYREYPSRFLNFIVPASNAYNPFGRDVGVNYYPVYEIENGLIAPSYTDSENRQRNFSLGLFQQFGGGHELDISVSRSESEGGAKVVAPRANPHPRDPGRAAFDAALASSDPNVAPNLFGNGTAQKASFADLLVTTLGPDTGFTEKMTYDALLRGEAFRAWGGAIRYAIGAELIETRIWSEESNTLLYEEDGSPRRTGRDKTVGVEKPTRDSTAYFAELAVPLVGKNNARSGLRELTLSLQARRDEHKTEGAAGSDDSGAPRLQKASRSATSPRLGLTWKPVENFRARAAWSKSFTPPVFSDQFSVTSERRINFTTYVDPYHPDRVTTRITIPTVNRLFNTDIRNEHADNWALGFEWRPESVPGFAWSVDWGRVDFTDKITRGVILLLNDPEIAFNLPSLVERDENGYAVQINRINVNLAEKINETIDTSIQYSFNTSRGFFRSRISYHRVLEEFYRITLDTERVDRVGTALGSDRYKLVGYLGWTAGRFGADLFARYTPGYTNNRVGTCPFGVTLGRCDKPFVFPNPKPPIEMDAMTTIDLTVTYSMDNGLRLRAGGRNIFNADNPTIWETLPYDPTRWDARGRVLYLELNYEM